MVNEQVLTVSLEEFGLSKYEAQAYVALISKGTYRPVNYHIIQKFPELKFTQHY